MKSIIEKHHDNYSVIFLKYYGMAQIPLTLVALVFIIADLFQKKYMETDSWFFDFSLLMCVFWTFFRALFAILFYALYKRISSKKHDVLCYILLFIGLFDMPVGTLLSSYTAYRLFRVKTVYAHD